MNICASSLCQYRANTLYSLGKCIHAWRGVSPIAIFRSVIGLCVRVQCVANNSDQVVFRCEWQHYVMSIYIGVNYMFSLPFGHTRVEDEEQRTTISSHAPNKCQIRCSVASKSDASTHETAEESIEKTNLLNMNQILNDVQGSIINVSNLSQRKTKKKPINSLKETKQTKWTNENKRHREMRRKNMITLNAIDRRMTSAYKSLWW